jgi:hypothetical protein
MNQAIGAYLDCFLFIVFGGSALIFAPAAMRKGGKGQQNAKYIQIVKIAGAVALVVGLVKLASKLFGWGL